MDEARWHALQYKDGKSVAPFFYGVTSTMIYCRSTCKARLPKRANVVYFETTEAAETTGFRACKRCRPTEILDAEFKFVDVACREMEQAASNLVIGDLIKSLGVSHVHFYRSFKRKTGFTPREYLIRFGSDLKLSQAEELSTASSYGSKLAAGYDLSDTASLPINALQDLSSYNDQRDALCNENDFFLDTWHAYEFLTRMSKTSRSL